MMADIPSNDLDQWLEYVKECKFLEEDKLKMLCEKVDFP